MLFSRCTSRCTLAAAATTFVAAVHATEHFDIRTIPGNGGSDMSAPLEPGLYLQLPSFFYEGKAVLPASIKQLSSAALFSGSAAPLATAFPDAMALTPVQSTVRVHVQALAPRLTYMSYTKFLGASIGFTAQARLVAKQAEVTNQVGATTLSGVDSGTLNALTSGSLTPGAIAAGANSAMTSLAAGSAAAQTGSSWGIGDLELGPILRWATDETQLLLVPSLIAPTGKYDAQEPTSPGSGDYYTFRPSLQIGHIGDGWDAGLRASLSVNTRNRATGYHSGNYINLDGAYMRSFGDATRFGLAGYALIQTTHDTSDSAVSGVSALTVNQKGRVYGLGPNFAWIKGAEDMLVEVRVLKEFGAQYRPEGTSAWLNVSMPLK